MCGFCDSLELGVLQHAFSMESMISLLQLHVPSWCNLRQLVVVLNYIKGPQSTSEFCCENFYHCQSIIRLTHESFFFTSSWGGEVFLSEYCALVHKDQKNTYSLKLCEIWNWGALLPFSLRSQEMRGWVCTCNHPSKSQAPRWLLLLLVVALATVLAQTGFIESSATELLWGIGFLFLFFFSLLIYVLCVILLCFVLFCFSFSPSHSHSSIMASALLSL